MLVYIWDEKEQRARIKKVSDKLAVKYIGWRWVNELVKTGESHRVLAKDAEKILHYWKTTDIINCRGFEISDEPWV